MDRAWINLKNVLAKWIKDNKNVLLIALIAGFVCHIYGITNMLGGDDRILNYYTGKPTIEQALQRANSGRWLASIVELGLGWYKSPVVTGFLTIIIMAFSAIFYSEIFGIKDDLKRSLVAIVFEVFPAVCVFITLAPDTFSYGVSFLACNLAMYLLVKSSKMKTIICAIGVLFLGLSLWLPNISAVLMTLIYYVLYQILIEQKESGMIAFFY
ncbi:glucosyltransferase domain-containing protein [Butyrivibrio fibrisolvens]|uniref:glucosyltransferase domain-containing protein n=1 Tax=Butyrivibrio fibrisolvens TaxID=831 RepID=UPI0020BE07CD|nr:glucosyltransferase domain-containing protein [Butyrivibrio fibrisolvens]